jgi:hypothetical protein
MSFASRQWATAGRLIILAGLLVLLVGLALEFFVAIEPFHAAAVYVEGAGVIVAFLGMQKLRRDHRRHILGSD